MNTGLSVFDFFNSEVWKGPHPPLVLGWRDDQLAPVVELLGPLLPVCLPNTPEKVITPAMERAIAACARSLVVAFVLTDKAVRYSRDRNHYGGAPRYRRDDRYYSHHYVTGAMGVLDHLGLVGHDLGQWGGSGTKGGQSVAWPTGALVELLVPVIDIAEPCGEPHEAEVIVLRDREEKKQIDYEDTGETNAMRIQVQALNDALAMLELFLNGRRFPIPLLRRIFNVLFDRGGRFYHHGPSHQNIPAGERRALQLLLDGVLHWMVEVDYANQHAVMAYTEAGLAIPSGDLYVIEGFDRTLVKRAFNILLNAQSRHRAVSALTQRLAVKDYDLWRYSRLATRSMGQCYRLADAVIAAIEDKHQPIAEFFGSDQGARFQRRDSDMALRVMERVFAETGRCPLVVHDSFLVADIDQGVLVRVMQQVAVEEGLALCLKDSEGQSWPATI
ncbi:MAG TPA: hypothetical protein PLH92_09485 [Mycobacterium sp.]|nr:hypothetical protein [Mycobacterium sp.]HQC76939.1 hypothetical protein [Mycobacterium sp.]